VLPGAGCSGIGVVAGTGMEPFVSPPHIHTLTHKHVVFTTLQQQQQTSEGTRPVPLRQHSAFNIQHTTCSIKHPTYRISLFHSSPLHSYFSHSAIATATTTTA